MLHSKHLYAFDKIGDKGVICKVFNEGYTKLPPADLLYAELPKGEEIIKPSPLIFSRWFEAINTFRCSVFISILLSMISLTA